MPQPRNKKKAAPVEDAISGDKPTIEEVSNPEFIPNLIADLSLRREELDKEIARVEEQHGKLLTEKVRITSALSRLVAK